MYKQEINLSLTSCLKYYPWNNAPIWLSESILAHDLRTNILADKGFLVKLPFDFRLFPEKTNTKIFQNAKNKIFDPFLSKKEFSSKFCAYQFF